MAIIPTWRFSGLTKFSLIADMLVLLNANLAATGWVTPLCRKASS